MTNSKKRKMLGRMNSTAKAVGLGDMFPIVISKTLASSDISSSKTVIDTCFDFKSVCAVTVITSAGVLRAVTKAEKDGTSLGVTATSMAAGDTVTITVC